MFKIIFLSLLIYIHSLYEAYVGGFVTWFKRKSTNEYIIVYRGISYSTASTYYIKDGNVALIDEKEYIEISAFRLYENNLTVNCYYTYHGTSVEYRGKIFEFNFYTRGERIEYLTYSTNNLLFLAKNYYQFFDVGLHLYLLKKPYKEIYKKIYIDTSVDLELSEIND